MTGPDTDDIDLGEFFARVDDENYPGSRHKRRTKITAPAPQAGADWDARPFTKIVAGQRIQMFTVGALATAVKRRPVTVRLWIRKGLIPQAPFRLPTQEVNGKQVPGRRLYTRCMIESLVELFAEAGLLDSPRVEWSDHPELPDLIHARWQQCYEDAVTPREEE